MCASIACRAMTLLFDNKNLNTWIILMKRLSAILANKRIKHSVLHARTDSSIFLRSIKHFEKFWASCGRSIFSPVCKRVASCSFACPSTTNGMRFSTLQTKRELYISIYEECVDPIYTWSCVRACECRCIVRMG